MNALIDVTSLLTYHNRTLELQQGNCLGNANKVISTKTSKVQSSQDENNSFN